MGRPKKIVIMEGEDTTDETVEEVTPFIELPSFCELTELRERRHKLLDLRNAMAAEGINDVSNLDVRLSQLNQRILELES